MAVTEFLNVRTSYDTRSHYSPYDISINMAFKGFGIMMTYFNTDQDFARTLSSKKDPLVLFTNQAEDFARLNDLAKANKRQKNTLIVWDGSEQTKPEAQEIPVLSTERMNAEKGMLNWEELCRMAQDDTPLPQRKPFWKRIFG